MVWNELTDWLQTVGVTNDTLGPVQDMFAEFDEEFDPNTPATAWLQALNSQSRFFDRFNALPRRQGQTYECKEVLFAVCLDRDNMRDVINESLVHVSLICPETKAVVLLTTKGDPLVWRDMEEEIVSWPTYAAIFKGPAGQVVRAF